MENNERFSDLKRAFHMVTRDPGWWWKVLICGPMVFCPLTFLIPLGFTMEVLRRAKKNPEKFVLPGFGLALWGRYAKEGLVKLLITFGTLLVPVLAWMGFTWAVALIFRFPGCERWQFFFRDAVAVCLTGGVLHHDPILCGGVLPLYRNSTHRAGV